MVGCNRQGDGWQVGHGCHKLHPVLSFVVITKGIGAAVESMDAGANDLEGIFISLWSVPCAYEMTLCGKVIIAEPFDFKGYPFFFLIISLPVGCVGRGEKDRVFALDS